MPQRMGISNSLCMIMASTAMMPPMVSEPVSPMKICAGKALYHRKPMSAPTMAQIKMTNSCEPGTYIIFR